MELIKLKELLHSKKDTHLNELFSVIRQKSISATGEGINECADLVASMMNNYGIATKVLKTEGNPVIYGEVFSNLDALTVLIYGHYDVVPADNINSWNTKPFEPVVHNGRIFARGSSDNKGQFMAHLLAIKELNELGWPDINVKILLDGEEECGSKSLPNFIENNKDLLKADVAISSDGPKHPSGSPLIFFGLRGLLSIELTAYGATKDLHSGRYGNSAPTPAWDLIHLLNKMFSKNKFVNIPEFYDDIQDASSYEKQLANNIPFNINGYEQLMNKKNSDISGYDYWFDQMFKPTFNICSLNSGYLGEGIKTIVPNKAVAKIDMRLVPNQNPNTIYDKLSLFVKQNSNNITVKKLSQLPATGTSPSLPICKEVVKAVQIATGQRPVVQPRLGGSGPDYLIRECLGIPSIWVPFANADADNHGANENFIVEDFYQGIVISAYLFYYLGSVDKTKLNL